MKKFSLREMIFLALCCDLGLFSKRLISPAANILTDALHIPGGIGTSFSLMFLVIAAALLTAPGCASLMGLVQSVLALSFGMVGSMGALSPIGYIVPGMIIDLVMLISRKLQLDKPLTMVTANMLGAVSASLTANVLVFRLQGFPLALYAAIALTAGALFGSLAVFLVRRLSTVITFEKRRAES